MSKRYQVFLSNFWTPYRVVLSFFIGLIGFGTFLLMLPIATVSGKSASFITALFTTTSAVCVTGLVVVDTGSYWSTFGQAVILVLMEVGGLGFASISVLLLVVVRHHPSLNERMALQSALGTINRRGVVKLSLFIIQVTLVCEAIGAFFLFLGWREQYDTPQAIWWAIFHAVSAFTNASFDLTGTTQAPFVSLVGYTGNYFISLTIPLLVIAGGLGFGIYAELLNYRKTHKFCVQTRIVLFGTFILLLGGTMFVWLVERNNPQTLGSLSLPDQLVAAFLHATCPRTAGFNTVNIGAFHNSTILLVIILMFIGGGSGSTAGGLKVGTLVVILAAIRTIILGRENTNILQRRVPTTTVEQAFAVGALYTFSIGLVTMFISLFDEQPLQLIVFEVTSAFSTTGYSLGITPNLTVASKLCLVAAMFFGRIGPVLLITALSSRVSKRALLNYPKEDVAIG